MLVPALLMVSTIRFRSFKTIDLRHAAQLPRPDLLSPRSIAAVVSRPHEVLLVMAYAYLASAFVGLALSNAVRPRGCEGRRPCAGETPNRNGRR